MKKLGSNLNKKIRVGILGGSFDPATKVILKFLRRLLDSSN